MLYAVNESDIMTKRDIWDGIMMNMRVGTNESKVNDFYRLEWACGRTTLKRLFDVVFWVRREVITSSYSGLLGIYLLGLPCSSR